MYFPWKDYEELPVGRRNTLQVFITNKCNLKCDGCFARNAMEGDSSINLEEYNIVVNQFLKKGGK
jgi:molybdenum cofactor biosynthesis enzyme MoaA